VDARDIQEGTLPVWHLEWRGNPAVGLLRFGAAAVPALADVLGDPALDDHAHNDFRELSAQLLGIIASESKAAILPLLHAARGPNSRVAEQALSALASLGEDGKEIVPALMARLQRADKDSWLRDQTIYRLGQIGPAAKAAVPVLGDLARAGGGDSHVAATWALWKVTHDPGEVLRPALTILKAHREPRNLVRHCRRRAVDWCLGGNGASSQRCAAYSATVVDGERI
jgi:HEAT repeat protein